MKTGVNGGDRGFTLVEVMMALVIFSVGILGVASMHISSITGNHYVMEHTQALSMAKSRIDRLMMLSYNDVVSSSETINGNIVIWEVDPPVHVIPDGSGDLKKVKVIVKNRNGAKLVSLSFFKPKL